MRKLILIFLCALVAVGCKEEQAPSAVIQKTEDSRSATAAPSSEVTTAPAAEVLDEATLPPAPTKAQPRLQTLKLWIGTNEVTAELALSPLQIQTGMMWRTNMAEMDGMLFVFPRPHQVSFWMRNTLLPLTCAYIDPQGTILETHDMKPRDLSSIKANSDQVQYVLEMNQGWFARNGVAPGSVIRTERGTLPETFFKARQ